MIGIGATARTDPNSEEPESDTIDCGGTYVSDLGNAVRDGTARIAAEKLEATFAVASWVFKELLPTVGNLRCAKQSLVFLIG